MAYASPSDVAARLEGTQTAEESARIQVLLNDVESIIVERVPDLADRIVAVPPTVSLETVKRVECFAVMRFLDNPYGRTSENLDDYGWRRDGDVRGGLYLTDDEWALLVPAVVDQCGAFEIVLGPG